MDSLNKKKREDKKPSQNNLISDGKRDPTRLHRSQLGENMKLAATAAIVNARLRSHDMPVRMQQHALRRIRSLLDAGPTTKLNLTAIARSLKQEFDWVYGAAWQCVVGTSFGSYVTHSAGGFVYFSVDDVVSVLLFKTEVKLVAAEVD